MSIIQKAKPADAIEGSEDGVTDDAPEELQAEDTADADAGTMVALAAAPEPEAAAEGADSLLDMFTSVGHETVDRSVLTNLAEEVEMTDLVSELNLVAAALGIVMSERQQLSEEDDQELAA